MPGDDNQSDSLLEYFRALRAEIIEAQKLRIQVALAKAVFLGTLLGFFFRDAKGDLTILICPFVALMFDCMVYGLSFNIRDLGDYIGEHIETQMALEEPWQCHRRNRVARGFKDWGRMAFRVGSYGLSCAVTVVSFAESMPPAGTRLLSGGWIWRIVLIMILSVAWCALIFAEFSSKRATRVLVIFSWDDDISNAHQERMRQDQRLRTYDFHQGFALRSPSMRPEANELFQVISTAIENTKPDVLLIHTGAAYERSPEAFADALRRIRGTYPTLRLGFQRRDLGNFLERLGIFEQSDGMKAIESDFFG